MKFTVTDKKVRDTLSKMETAITELDRVLIKVAILVQTSIKRRVIEGGRGIDGKMTYGNLKYALKRNKKGRQVAYMDLLFSGRMWRALTSQVVESGKVKKVKIFFGDAESNLKALGNNNRQAFFGLGPDENSVIDDAMSMVLKGMF